MKSLYKDNENLKNQLNFNFLTNNVKGLQSTEKRLKLFNFLKNKDKILKTKFTNHMVKLIHLC